jgi:hypothetical protein
MSYRILLSFLAVLAAVGSPTRAASVYSFDQAVYTVSVGGAVSVPVYLLVTGNDRDELINGNGLESAAVELTSLELGLAEAFINGETEITPNVDGSAAYSATQFDFYSRGAEPDGSAGNLLTYIENTEPLGIFGVDNGTSNRILIGTFRFTAGPAALAGEETVFTTTYTSPDSQLTQALSGFNLAPNVENGGAASVTIRVTGVPVVPLPASAVAGMALLAAGGVWKLIRKRR